MTFNEKIRLLTEHGFKLIKESGSVRYYGKQGWPSLVRIDYHGPKEVPKGTNQAILRAAAIRERKRK